MPEYDFIIVGAGAAGILLADQLLQDSFFVNKRILILDASDKSTNDRTWCFWEMGEGSLDHLTYKTWPKIQVETSQVKQVLSIEPFVYKMIKGIDFYQYFLTKFTEHPNIDFLQREVQIISESRNQVEVCCESQNFCASYVFDSRFDYQNLLQTSRYPVLQQHFLGWFVQTEVPVFQPNVATFMDFSVPQKGNTRFMYVLPFSEHEALVEYTLFSQQPLPKEEYEREIKVYLKERLGAENYQITDTEQGNIPMCVHPMWENNTDRVVKIGMAGGWAKPSTGYTFNPSKEKVYKLLQYFKEGKSLSKFGRKDRFWFYDLLLLDILYSNNHLGSTLFGALFRNRKPQLVFKFLDEKTNFWEDFLIMSAPNPIPFIQALWRRVSGTRYKV